MISNFEKIFFGGNAISENPIFALIVVFALIVLIWYAGIFKSYLPLTGNRGDPAFWEYSYDMQNAIARKVAESASPKAAVQNFGIRAKADWENFSMRENDNALVPASAEAATKAYEDAINAGSIKRFSMREGFGDEYEQFIGK